MNVYINKYYKFVYLLSILKEMIDPAQWNHRCTYRHVLIKNEPLKNNLLGDVEIYVEPIEKAIF